MISKEKEPTGDPFFRKRVIIVFIETTFKFNVNIFV